MKPDELTRALDDLAGADPSIADALTSVTGRARRDRLRNRATALGVVVCILALAAFGVNRYSHSSSKVFVRNPPPAVDLGNVADFTWSRVAAPDMTISRIVTAGGRTFAVGSSPDRRASIAELQNDGSITNVDPTAAYDVPRPSGRVNDLIAMPGALIAVGQSARDTDATSVPEVWRSTDRGQTWRSVPVETPTHPYSVIGRVLVSHGVVYAIGDYDRSNMDPAGLPCPIPVWRSDDGTDFRLTSAPATCVGGDLHAAVGPSGLLFSTGSNATAWHLSGTEWSPRSISSGVANSIVTDLVGDEHGYVAVGYVDADGAIWWSADGRSWRRVASTRAPADQVDRRAYFTSVVHAAAGWIAVGFQTSNRGPVATDAVMWTSTDGEIWAQSGRDEGVFEQYARADHVGITRDGVAILGSGNLIGDTTDGRENTHLWLGSNAQPRNPLGIVEGELIEVGGPAPGVPKAVSGTLTARMSDGSPIEVSTGSDGRFSTQIAPGTYNIVGHSPLYGDGKYDCTAVGPAIVRANSVAHVTLICSIK